VKGLTRLGEAFLERKEFGAARERFARARGLEPHNVFALRGLATALRGMRDYRAAIPVFEELARLNPRTTGCLCGWVSARPRGRRGRRAPRLPAGAADRPRQPLRRRRPRAPGVTVPHAADRGFDPSQS